MELKNGDFIIVRCPAGFANILLNNNVGIVTAVTKNSVYVTLLTGCEKGREWQFDPTHIRIFPRRKGGLNSTSTKEAM